MKTQIILLSAIIITTTCIARAVPVGTVDIAHTGYGAIGQLKVWGGGLYGSRVYGGVYTLDKTDGTGQGNIWPDEMLGAFCIELSEGAPKKTSEYDVVMPEETQKPTDFLGDHIGLDKAEYLSELWGRFFDKNWLGDGPFTYSQKRNAEAFSAAIWEIVYEKLPESPADWNVKFDGTYGSLGFKCSETDTSLANSWLHALDGTGPKAELRAFVYDGKQDYLVEVPEPATICILGLGTLVLFRKRKTKCN
ncbi:MAG: PEP-CTERM sorting domain-containing protein [Phycisphaerae bacterium]|nr:PEP-CTERM sorting domain-containing protein [Phycisphaerae bacterium]